MPLWERHPVKHQNQLFGLLGILSPPVWFLILRENSHFQIVFLVFSSVTDLCWSWNVGWRERYQQVSRLSASRPGLYWCLQKMKVIGNVHVAAEWRFEMLSLRLHCRGPGLGLAGTWSTIELLESCMYVNSFLLCFSMFSHDANTNRDVTCYP